ncbi:carbohydrate ABC transporter permease [Paenibacillus cellulositrophicus]|uniref:carbohydrate ABC transporter permease n=1 Tax=Paenibacillus cellulositrophicus TaxID=562959 RepID=UPI0012678206|nr:carbohydrate ABC transporter permease [Paenibacillus cellulositrophicus]
MKKSTTPIGMLLQVVVNIVVLLFTLSALFPIVWMVYTSVKSNPDFSLNTISLPTSPTLENYANAFEIGNIGSAIFSSLLNTVIPVPIIILFSFIIGYFFSRIEFRGKKLLMVLFLAGMMIPIHALLVPLFVQFKWFGMLDNRFTLILPYIAFHLPVAIFLFDSFIKGISREIEEAAYIDGSSFDNTMFRVIFPICLPIMSTVAILSILGTWNEFSFALVLNKSSDLFTLPIWLTFFSGQHTTDYTGKIAGLVITSLPIIVMYLFFSNKIMSGMTAGAVKG